MYPIRIQYIRMCLFVRRNFFLMIGACGVLRVCFCVRVQQLSREGEALRDAILLLLNSLW